MNIVGIIPGRMASSRFPGKPLAKICGIPMIGHVYFRSKMCKTLNDVYVATCDEDIAQYVHSIGGGAIMTANTHERASDRAAEALVKIEEATGRRVDVAVMIQGDEPMLYPQMIDEALKPLLEDDSVSVVNLMSLLKSREEQEDENVVKVVVDNNHDALYFSREPIPSRKKAKKDVVSCHKQIAIIPFRRDFLFIFNQLSPTPLEIIESVDMLRFLEHGYKVKMVLTEYDTYGVDTPSDLIRVERLMQANEVFLKYRTGSRI